MKRKLLNRYLYAKKLSELEMCLFERWIFWNLLCSGTVTVWYGKYPDSETRIRTTGLGIRILLLSSVTFKICFIYFSFITRCTVLIYGASYVVHTYFWGLKVNYEEFFNFKLNMRAPLTFSLLYTYKSRWKDRDSQKVYGSGSRTLN